MSLFLPPPHLLFSTPESASVVVPLSSSLIQSIVALHCLCILYLFHGLVQGSLSLKRACL